VQQDILVIPEQRSGSFYLSLQHVSFYKDLTCLKKTLSQEDLIHFLDLYEKSHKTPKNVLPFLQLLKTKYPRTPEIYNLLSYVYLRLKKIKLADQHILEAYKHCQNNLLTQINYADYCLRKNKPEKIPEIFKNLYDLKKLYPSRSSFHVTEFRSFMVVMSLYHLKIQDREKALCYHYLAKKIDGNHPSVLFLQKKLYKSSLVKNLLLCFFNLKI